MSANRQVIQKCIPLKVGMVECSGRKNLECEELTAPLKLLFVYHGRLGLDRGPQWIELSEGDILLMKQNERSRAAIAYPPDIIYFWLLFEPTSVEIDLPENAKVARPRRLADLFQLLLEDQESGMLRSESSMRLIESIFAEIQENRLFKGQAISSDEKHAQRALTFIHAHFREPISTQEIADELQISADHLGRVFKKVTNKTLIQEVQHARLREARLQLLESHATIERIACDCGFADGGYFRRVFRKIEGMNPARFRSQFSAGG